jgi:GAF domain-containing protein
METLTTETRCLLIAEAERARAAVDARCAAVSQYEPEWGHVRTLINVGTLSAWEERFPEDELYQLDAFPSVAALCLHGIPYMNPEDVSSASIAARSRHGHHGAVPIVADGAVWGELWVARDEGAGRLTDVDLDRLRMVAARIADGLPPQPSR